MFERPLAISINSESMGFLERKKLLSQGNGGKPQPPWTKAETIALLSDLEATPLAFRKAVNYEMSSRLLKRIETEESAQSSPQPIQKQVSV